MRIVLAGGSGQIGAILNRTFAGHEVVVLSRSGAVRWDGRTLGPWTEALEGADALINLAGRTVDCRYTAANRREIMTSRLESTRVLREAAGVPIGLPVNRWMLEVGAFFTRELNARV